MQLGATVSLDAAVGMGISAASVNIEHDTSDSEIDELKQKYASAKVTPVQAGGYCNLISTDERHRKANILKTKALLRRADLMGCRTVVVGGGHRDPDNPHEIFSVHPENWQPEALDLLAESCRDILSDLDLSHTKLVVETWVMTPLNSPKAVAKLVAKVDHPNFGILFDPVNMMNLERYYQSGEFIEACITAFGDAIALVHAKDTLLRADPFTFHMAEAPVGQGQLDYRTLMRALDRLSADLPLVVEHLKEDHEYKAALAYLRQVAREEGVDLWRP